MARHCSPLMQVKTNPRSVLSKYNSLTDCGHVCPQSVFNIQRDKIPPMSSDILEITLLSLKVSLLATGISLFIGLPLGTLLALRRMRGRKFILSIINTGMALPPVVVGLFVAMMLWRSGPLG